MLPLTNPSIIQRGPSTSGHDATPLILIHDGSGTCCSYYSLGRLDRTVYGISNPRFTSGRPWAGGIPEMARIYVNLIRTVIPQGPIIVGGWSLGGMIALEIASILTLDTSLTVAGVILLDSFHPRLTSPTTPFAICKPAFSSTCKAEVRFAVQRCFRQAGDLIDQWKVPQWPSQVTEVAYEYLPARSYRRTFNSLPSTSAADDSGCHSPTSSNASESHTPPSSTMSPVTSPVGNSSPVTPQALSSRLESYIDGTTAAPPPVILLKAEQRLQTQTDTRLDADRDDRMLGWSKTGLITMKFNLPGDHFSIFERYVNNTTTEIANACQQLDCLLVH